MDDTVLRVAATIYGEAAVLGLPGLFSVAYVMACRMERVQYAITWQEELGEYMGGWSWYKKNEGAIEGYANNIEALADTYSYERTAYVLAWLLVKGDFGPHYIAALAEVTTGLQLDYPLYYCMSAQDVKVNKWIAADVIVPGPKGYALHLYREFPESKHGNLTSNTP